MVVSLFPSLYPPSITPFPSTPKSYLQCQYLKIKDDVNNIVTWLNETLNWLAREASGAQRRYPDAVRQSLPTGRFARLFSETHRILSSRSAALRLISLNSQ